MSDKRTFWNRDRGCADLIIFGPILFLVCVLFGSCGSTTAASFSTDGVIVSSTVIESMMVTIAADSPVAYELSVAMTFDLDDSVDKAFLSSAAVQTVADSLTITRTTMTTEFIPGDFPDPGGLVNVTTIRTADYDTGGLSAIFAIGRAYAISEDVSGFFFDFPVASNVIIAGLLTESVSIDGSAPTIETTTFSISDFYQSENRIRINPDLSLSLERGSFFAASGISGFKFSYVVPEPSGMFLAFMAVPLISIRSRSRRLQGGQ